MFVTPESATTKGFRAFVHRLQARQALDRVVVDECHVLTDGDDDFRPQVRALGPSLQDWGVQTVFLTATLPPRDERVFFQTAGVITSRIRLFRARTTRTNIAYRIRSIQARRGRSQAEEEDRWACREVRTWFARQGRGRAIVYASTIARVEGIADVLACPRFSSKIGSEAVKQQTFEAWRD